MRAYESSSSAQIQLHRSAVRNLVKNSSMGRAPQAKAGAVPGASKEILPRNIDAFLPNARIPDFSKDMVTVGRDYDVSKEDAWDRLTRPGYKMDVGLESAPVYQDPEKGISNDLDFFWAKADMAGFTSPDALRQNVDYVASRYAAMRERINAEFYGDEKAANLSKLDEMMNAAKENLAQRFADEMSGFFDENGISNDRESLYKSVLTAVDQKTAEYDSFIKSNQGYANISDPGEDWLRKDSAYMASELRKAMESAGVSQSPAPQTDNGYTLDEMEKLYDFSKELESYSDFSANPTKAVLTGNYTEETLGMMLAELSLKGKVFNEKAGISDKVKDIVNQSIDHFISTAVEAEQAHMDKWSSLQIQAVNRSAREGAYSASQAADEIQKIERAHTAVDKDTVYAVIDKVIASYEETGDASKALMDGAVFAKDSYNSKAQSKEYDGIRRYDSTTSARYWDNFFTLGTNKGYMQTSSGLDAMIGEWNRFMGKVTDSGSALLNRPAFSATV